MGHINTYVYLFEVSQLVVNLYLKPFSATYIKHLLITYYALVTNLCMRYIAIKVDMAPWECRQK